MTSKTLLAALAAALALGVPTVPALLLGTVTLSVPAKADIVCNRGGCRETGRTIRRNGSYYRGLGLPAGYHQINGTQPKTVNKQNNIR
jgi:hypothetical protein